MTPSVERNGASWLASRLWSEKGGGWLATRLWSEKVEAGWSDDDIKSLPAQNIRRLPVLLSSLA